MESSIITLIVALICIVIAWKVFKGIIKTVVLLVILLAAAAFVFGNGGFA